MSEKIELKDFDAFKAKMIRKAKKNGLDENFGMEDIDKLKRKFGYDHYGTIDERINAEIIDELQDWLDNLDLMQIKKWKE